MQVTVVHNVSGDMEALLAELKTAVGAGGLVREGDVEIQVSMPPLCHGHGHGHGHCHVCFWVGVGACVHACIPAYMCARACACMHVRVSACILALVRACAGV